MHKHYKTPGQGRQPRREAIPERFQRIIDRVSDHDRAWFLANPGHDRFVRDAVPGEYGPMGITPDLTLVTNYGGHLRIRAPILEIAPSRNGIMTIFELTGERYDVPVVRLGAS